MSILSQLHPKASFTSEKEAIGFEEKLEKAIQNGLIEKVPSPSEIWYREKSTGAVYRYVKPYSHGPREWWSEDPVPTYWNPGKWEPVENPVQFFLSLCSKEWLTHDEAMGLIEELEASKERGEVQSLRIVSDGQGESRIYGHSATGQAFELFLFPEVGLSITLIKKSRSKKVDSSASYFQANFPLSLGYEKLMSKIQSAISAGEVSEHALPQDAEPGGQAFYHDKTDEIMVVTPHSRDEAATARWSEKTGFDEG